MENRDILVGPAIERYLRFIKAEEDKSPLTILNYEQFFRMFRTLCPTIKTINQINKHVIREYKLQLHEFRTIKGKPLSISSRNRALVVLRNLLRYLATEEELIVFPSTNVKTFKREGNRKIKFLSSEELIRLFNTPSPDTIIGLRDRAILQFFFSTGLRRTELVSLNRNEINIKTGELSIRGKRQKIRLVFLNEQTIAALTKYINARKDILVPLFVRSFQQLTHVQPPGEFYRLTAQGVYYMVKKYMKQAEISGKHACHSLRHSFATNLLRNGADLRSVQEMLGHSNLSTTQIYTHVTNTQLKESHQKFSGLK